MVKISVFYLSQPQPQLGGQVLMIISPWIGAEHWADGLRLQRHFNLVVGIIISKNSSFFFFLTPLNRPILA